MLLAIKIYSIIEKQDCKKDALGARGIGYVKMIFALSIKGVAFYIEATIIQVDASGVKGPISRCIVCFAIFLALNK